MLFNQIALVAENDVGISNYVVTLEFNISGKSNPLSSNCVDIFFHKPGLLKAKDERTYSPSSPLSASISV